MTFRTKLDFSSNRQVKQDIETITVLSGGTTFGVPFESLPSGIDFTTTGQTSYDTGVGSTFSGNSGTTNFYWGKSIMAVGSSTLSAITASNSGDTQYTIGYSGSSFVTVDGNYITTSFTGVTFDITPVSFFDIGGGSYTGTVTTTDLVYFSANSLSFTGRTIWADVSGITRTNELIISKTPIVGGVFVCSNTEGKGGWSYVSGLTDNLWVAGSGLNSVRMNNGSNLAGGDNSIAEGFNNQAKGNQSHAQGYGTEAAGNQSHSQGLNTVASGARSFSSGENSVASGGLSFVHGSASTASGESTIVLGTGVTGTTDNTTYVVKLNINNLSVYADNTAAASLETGTVYRTSTGQLMVKY